ncbi:MAG: glycosyltransferase [Pirellulales bacterium]|nr:glycosyltransferase [Pirellulales bacterium]
MKILLLSASYRGGGAERVQITLAREFLRLGHSIHFIAFEDDGPLHSHIPEGVHLTCFSTSRVASAVVPLVHFLQKEKPDVVIAAMTHVGLIACIAKRIANWRGKLMIRLDGSQRQCRDMVPLCKRLVQNLLQRFLFPREHAMIAVSNTIAKEFIEDFRLRNCHVLPNPVATSFRENNDSMMPQHPFFESGEPIIIAIGRLHKEKGFHFLLKAFAVLNKSRSAKLLILGEGGERSHLESEIKRLGISCHVDLPGFIDDPVAYLKQSSVYVLCSETEAFGLTLVEALSTGIPVVCTRTAGSRDIVTHQEIGDFIDYGDTHALAAALQRAIDTPNQNREIRIARAADFAPERIARQYLQLIINSEKTCKHPCYL